MIFVQLIDEPTVWRGSRTAGPDKLDGLCGVEAVSGDEVATHNSDRATGTHGAVDEDVRIGTRAQSARDESRRAREVRRELREWRVVQRNLRCVRSQRWGERDVSRHRR